MKKYIISEIFGILSLLFTVILYSVQANMIISESLHLVLAFLTFLMLVASILLLMNSRILDRFNKYSKRLNQILLVVLLVLVFGGIDYLSSFINLYTIFFIYLFVNMIVIFSSIYTINNHENISKKVVNKELENSKKVYMVMIPLLIAVLGLPKQASNSAYLLVFLGFLVQIYLIMNLNESDVENKKIDKLWLSKTILLVSIFVVILFAIYDIRGIIPISFAMISIYTLSGSET